MSRRDDKRWGLFKDPWRKLASVALAVLLWYFLDLQVTDQDERILEIDVNGARHSTKERIELSIPAKQFGVVKYLDGDTLQPIDPGKIVLRVDGPRGEIDKIKKHWVFNVNRGIEDIRSGSDGHFVLFRADELQHRDDIKHVSKTMIPETVRINLEKYAPKSLKLTEKNLDLDGLDPRLRSRIREVKFSPPTLDVYAPEDRLEEIRPDTKLFVVNFLESSINDGEVVIQLHRSVGRGFEWVQLEQTPTVTLTVEPRWEEITLKGVPVLLDCAALPEDDGAKYEVGEPRVDVMIGATGELLSQIKASSRQDEVTPQWILNHARVRVYLRPEDIRAPFSAVARTPTIQLFSTGQGFDEKPFVEGRDFIQKTKLVISIDVKKKGP
ncbi:MAG: hypothetical protein KDC87_12770 [Planctomycetes bacterium]|nr:hypothetical protein [Planctomycetota bacterium]